MACCAQGGTLIKGYYVDKDFHVTLAEGLKQLMMKKRLCDVAIICDREQFYAHKNVLAASSEYFHAMFAGGMSESRPSSKEVCI